MHLLSSKRLPISGVLIMCDVCRCTPCVPTCPNAEPEIYCALCDEKIKKGRKYFSAIDYNHRWAAFCSEDCLKQYFDIEEEEE